MPARKLDRDKINQILPGPAVPIRVFGLSLFRFASLVHPGQSSVAEGLLLLSFRPRLFFSFRFLFFTYPIGDRAIVPRRRACTLYAIFSLRNPKIRVWEDFYIEKPNPPGS